MLDILMFSISLLFFMIVVFLIITLYKKQPLVEVKKNNNIYMGDENMDKKEKNVLTTFTFSILVILSLGLITLMVITGSRIVSSSNVNQTVNQTQHVIINSDPIPVEIILIDLNDASKEELSYLPGIGETKAEAIVNYRIENPFKNVSELLNVYGIGQKTYDNIKHLVKVGG